MGNALANRWPTLARSRLVADIEGQLATAPPSCGGIALSGPPGAGASVLLDLVARRRPGLLVRHLRIRPTAADGEMSRPLTDLRALADDLPNGAIVCVDGLEELPDDAAADLAEFALARRIPVLGTVRARTAVGLSTSRHPLRHVHIVPVPPLSGEQADRLCTGRLGAPLEPLTLRRLLDLSDGWPGPLIAVVEHNMRLGSFAPRRGLMGAGALALPPSLTGPASPLVRARAGAGRAVLERAAEGPLDRAVADDLAGTDAVDDLLADGVLQSSLDGPAVLVDLSARARDVMVVPRPPADVAGRLAVIRAALREGCSQRALELAQRLRSDGIRARSTLETASGTALIAETQLENGCLADAEACVAQALCLLESHSPTDPLVTECLALAALCAAWRSAGPQARRLTAEAESHLQSSGGRAAVRLAETALLLGDAADAARRARRAAASAAGPDVLLAARTVLARLDPPDPAAVDLHVDEPADGPRGRPEDDAHPTESPVAVRTDSPRERLVRGLVTRDGRLLLDLARSWAASGLLLLAADTAARAEPLLRSLGDAAAAGRAGHLAANLLATNGIRRPAGWPATGTGGLTTREREVAALAIGGASTAEVAAALQLSVRTVENHLQHCYTKLGVGSRQELAEILGWSGVPDPEPSRSVTAAAPRSAVSVPGPGTRAPRPATRVPVSASPGGR